MEVVILVTPKNPFTHSLNVPAAVSDDQRSLELQEICTSLKRFRIPRSVQDQFSDLNITMTALSNQKISLTFPLERFARVIAKEESSITYELFLRQLSGADVVTHTLEINEKTASLHELADNTEDDVDSRK